MMSNPSNAMSSINASSAATLTSITSGRASPTSLRGSISSVSSPRDGGGGSGRDPTIRHAGRTHIRGKIRRVWRPRYLELCDSGLVKYYELPPTADVTLPEDSDWDHVHMIPKDSLVIYHARIIDVTTLRDLHVGLPKGSYGFLFRGQRQLSKELFQHPTDSNPPRDYFCAVSTLEEAQTWVIALQWAATMGHELRISASQNNQHPLSRLECYNPNHQYQPQGSADLETITKSKTSLDESQTSISTAPDGEHTTSQAAVSSTSRASPSGGGGSGRILVTKINGYRIVQTKRLQWVVAYEIALLLIQANKVEERRLLRTRDELVTLLTQLSTQINVDKKKIKKGMNIVDESNSLLQSLPYAFSSEKQILQSFTIVDKMLRHLVLESKVVNSQALKRCLALDNSTRLKVLSSPPKFYELYKPSANVIVGRSIRSISSTESQEDYVKRWLKTTTTTNQATRHRHHRYNHDDSSSMFPFWILQHPTLLWGCVGVVLASIVPLWKLYQRHIIFSVTIRFDVLLLTWLVAFYFGREILPSSSTSTTTKRSKRSSAQGASSSTLSPRATSAAAPGNSSTVVGTTTRSDEAGVLEGDGDDNDDEAMSSEEEEDDGEEIDQDSHRLSSPLPQYPDNNGESCWSVPPDISIFKVRGCNYLQDRIKMPSGPSPFICRGVDLWLTDNPERHIARHPSVLGGNLLRGEGGNQKDTFLVNFLLPFGNFVSYFEIPPLEEFPEKLATVWTKFLQGDQQYRDARLKLLPIVVEGPWIVKAAVGNGTAPALLGKVIPLQYFFRDPTPKSPGIYEVDVIITASSIAKGILSVVKGHTNALTIAFAFIIEAALPEELPETALCSFQVHSLHLEDCPHLPEYNLDDMDNGDSPLQ